MKFFLTAVAFLVLSACSTTTLTLKKSTLLSLKEAPVIGRTSSGQDIFLGGLSGLILKRAEGQNLSFWAITDRGPISSSAGLEKPFLLPDFNPQIIELNADLSTNTLEVGNVIKLSKKNDKAITGIPNTRTEENPVDLNGFMISLDPDGLDTEGITAADEGGFFVADEYGPSLLRFDSNGKLIRRMMPFNELPKIYAEKKPNRGFEAIARDQYRLFGFLQSPVTGEKLTRIVEVDLESLKTANEYFYSIDEDKDRIGDAVSLGNNKFLVVETNGKRGAEGKKAVYKITLAGGDQTVKKELLVDLQKTEFKDKEKIEGIAIIDKHRIVLVNDNDFQMAGKTDKATGVTPLSKESSDMLILEFSDDLTK